MFWLLQREHSGTVACEPLLLGYSTFVVIRAFDHNVGVKLLQLSVEGLQLTLGAAELGVHLLGIPLVSGSPAQILSALLDLQLLADLPADPLSVLVQALLHTWVWEVRVLVQTELLEHRQPTWVTLKERGGRVSWFKTKVKKGEGGSGGIWEGIKGNDVDYGRGIFQFELKQKLIEKMTSPPDSCRTVFLANKSGNSHPDWVKHRGMKGGENSNSEWNLLSSDCEAATQQRLRLSV